MKRGTCFSGSRFVLIAIVTFCLLISSNPFLQHVAVKQKEFDSTTVEKKISISRNKVDSIDIDFNDGEELEVVFSIQVKDENPIDVWFVNEDNFILLSQGAQFLFFIDGTAQQIAYTKKIVTLSEHDTYKLVMTNYYANKTVEVNLAYETRTYDDNSNDGSFNAVYLYISLIIIVVLVVLVLFLFLKNKRIGKSIVMDNTKMRTKGSKGKKPKKHKQRPERKSIKKSQKYKERKNVVIPNKDLAKYCGNCGKPVDTPFCKNCGSEA